MGRPCGPEYESLVVQWEASRSGLASRSSRREGGCIEFNRWISGSQWDHGFAYVLVLSSASVLTPATATSVRSWKPRRSRRMSGYGSNLNVRLRPTIGHSAPMRRFQNRTHVQVRYLAATSGRSARLERPALGLFCPSKRRVERQIWPRTDIRRLHNRHHRITEIETAADCRLLAASRPAASGRDDPETDVQRHSVRLLKRTLIQVVQQRLTDWGNPRSRRELRRLFTQHSRLSRRSLSPANMLWLCARPL